MSSSDVVAQSAFDVLRLGRSSQFIVPRMLRFWTPKRSRSMRQALLWLEASIHKIFDKWASEFEYELNPGISQCSSFGIGLPLNVLGSLAFWSRHQRFAMPLLRIAIQSPAGRPGPILYLSRLKRFNSEEAIEYRLIIVRPPCIKDDAPLQDETSGLG
ncbi:unnamed protein product [Brassica rapa]|uniref:Uncharacterized protein n=1 Tax=Brassica campestris TaxID=3711 RepID=A0A8D9M7M3_BRACM|nr:unnamed protein product [Brassica rapa]